GCQTTSAIYGQLAITRWKQLYESTLAVVKSADTYQKRGQPLDFTSEEREFFFSFFYSVIERLSFFL
ncbi:hypothetical protein CROQUDRAFT_666415, partial [Cronartium quercuum f. sp. fusiforme G11]